MKRDSTKRLELDTALSKGMLIGAQLLALLAYLLGLQFLVKTTGGTLFLFSTLAPLLVGLAALALIGVLTYKFLRRHSLFYFETFEPDQVIFRQGEEGDCAYFIHSGEVEVVRQENATEKLVARLSSGQYFGEMALISNAPRNATVRAATATKVAVLGKENFLTMLKVMPATQEDIMRKVQERAMQQIAIPINLKEKMKR